MKTGAESGNAPNLRKYVRKGTPTRPEALSKDGVCARDAEMKKGTSRMRVAPGSTLRTKAARRATERQRDRERERERERERARGAAGADGGRQGEGDGGITKSK
jgi:hypothetical protein